METVDVRYIPTDRSIEHGWSGNKPALCFHGEKKACCVVLTDEGIGTVEIEQKVIADSTLVPGPWGTPPYPVDRFVQRLVASGRAMSAEARELIESLLKKGKKKGKLPPLPPPKKLETRPAKAPLKTAGAELIITLAAEWKLPTPKLRRWLRSQGCRAPYTDEPALRKVLKKLKKGK
jgi:hypothetical protein